MSFQGQFASEVQLNHQRAQTIKAKVAGDRRHASLDVPRRIFFANPTLRPDDDSDRAFPRRGLPAPECPR
jgi:hypothetical protein